MLWKITGMLAALLVVGGCSTVTEDVDQSEGASTVNVEGAKVFVCDKSGDDEGCAPCSKKIGSYELTEDERQACTLKDLRGGLKDRVRFLVGQAGRKGAFLRSVSGDAPVRLREIKVLPAVGPGEKPREDVYTKLAGSFTVGEGDEQSGASGGVDIHSVRMSVRFAFVFEDSSSATIVRSEPFVMQNAYNLIPFFYTKASAGLNLSVGGILSSFTGTPEVANALLAVLGGNAGIHLEAQHEVKWAAPVCADTANDRSSADPSKLRVFDYDFYKNVLKPVCDQYKADTGAAVSCDFTSLTGDTDTFIEQSRKAIGNRRVLPLAACRELDQSRWFGLEPVYDVSFIAPERWGWAPNHEAWLYQSDARASNVWNRQDWVRVFGVATEGKCGAKTLAGGEVCVHAELARTFFGDECAAANGSSAPTLGIAQSEGTDGKILQGP
jgi:hypothetical protein